MSDEAQEDAVLALTADLTADQRHRVSDALRSLTSAGDLDAFLATIASIESLSITKPQISVPEISEDQLQALKRLPEIYGQVVPKSDRALTPRELAAIAEERQTIDLVLKLLEARKSESIRETLANHLDAKWRKEHPGQEPPTDRKGHVAAKDSEEVKGTGLKVERTVSGAKRVLSIHDVEALLAEGKIDRKTYLRLTTATPPAPRSRVLDEDGLVAAMKNDPHLAYLLAHASRVTDATTSITIKKA